MMVTRIDKATGESDTITLDKAADLVYRALDVTLPVARQRIVGNYQVETAFYIYRLARVREGKASE